MNEFKKGDRVFVRDSDDQEWINAKYKRYGKYNEHDSLVHCVNKEKGNLDWFKQ